MSSDELLDSIVEGHRECAKLFDEVAMYTMFIKGVEVNAFEKVKSTAKKIKSDSVNDMQKKVQDQTMVKLEHVLRYNQINDMYSMSFDYFNKEQGVSKFSFFPFFLASTNGILQLVQMLKKISDCYRCVRI